MIVNPDNGPEGLAALLHHRWALPVLALLQQSAGAKYVTLQVRLGVSRDSLRRTLDALMADGLVMRNPGYGHPLRPEYVLTPAGKRLAPAGVKTMALLARAAAEEVGLRKWSLPVVLAIGNGHRRFSDLRAALPATTARALTLTLKLLVAERLIERCVVDEHPPRSEYRLTARSRSWIRALRELASRCSGCSL
jgi:DNA-binding HxlR family transcriptional regulator